MRIRMLVEKTGPRYDGRSWPGPGGEIDVPGEEGAALCEHGDAAPVARPDADVELRGAESAGDSPGTSGAARPAPNAPKAAWVAYAVAQGASQADAESATKADLQELYGG